MFDSKRDRTSETRQVHSDCSLCRLITQVTAYMQENPGHDPTSGLYGIVVKHIFDFAISNQQSSRLAAIRAIGRLWYPRRCR